MLLSEEVSIKSRQLWQKNTELTASMRELFVGSNTDIQLNKQLQLHKNSELGLPGIKIKYYLICALSCVAIISSSCANTTANSSKTASLKPPAYLSVPDLNTCLYTKQNCSYIRVCSQKTALCNIEQMQCSYTSVCLPAQRPDNCPSTSWQQLQSEVPACTQAK